VSWFKSRHKIVTYLLDLQPQVGRGVSHEALLLLTQVSIQSSERQRTKNSPRAGRVSSGQCNSSIEQSTVGIPKDRPIVPYAETISKRTVN
jgi:hypothetical protein